jgi:hypothetical protein
MTDHFNAVRGALTAGGTGNVTAASTASGKARPLSTLPTGWQGGLRFDDPNGVDWELSLCTAQGGNVFSRDTLLCSSTGSKVNLAVGTIVLQTVVAEQLNAMLSVADIPFSGAIPLTRPGNSYMAAKTVSGPLTFTPAASAVRGALVYLRVIADGTNLPIYSAFKEWGGSMGYLNAAGIENQMQFFYDGFNYFVLITQAINAVAVPLPVSGVTLAGPTGGIVNQASANFTVGVTPVGGTITGDVVVTPTPVSGVTFTPTSRTVNNASPTGTFTATPNATGSVSIAVTNSGGLANPAAIGYTVSAAPTLPGTPAAPTATAGVNSASLAIVAPSTGSGTIDSYVVTPYLAGVAQNPQNITTLSSPLNITGLTAGNYTFTFHARSNVGNGAESPASNSVAVTGQVSTARRLTSLVGMTESASAPYVYSSDGSNYSGSDGPKGRLSATLPSGANGSIQFIISTSVGGGVMLGTELSPAQAGYGNWGYGTFGSTGNYNSLNGGISGQNGAALTPAVGDIVRWTRTGTTIVIDVARASSPTSFTVVQTYTNASTALLYFNLSASVGGALSNVSTSGGFA